MHVVVPVLGGNANWTKMVHTVSSQLKQNKKQKKPLSPLFVCNNLASVVKQQNPVLEQKRKAKTQNGHLGVSFCAKNGFV